MHYNQGENHPFWGKRHTKEAKEKQSKARKEWLKNNPHPKGSLGKHHSEESKKKTSIAMKKWWQENKNTDFVLKHNRKISKTMKGMKRPPFSEEWKRNIGKAATGEKSHWWGKFGKDHPAWKENCITPEHTRIRQSREFKEWRTAIFERDNYACVRCLEYSDGHLNAHHILSFALFPEERFEISNGATVCEECHKYIHTIELRRKDNANRLE